MQLSSHLAKGLRAVYFGGNWTVSSLKDHLSDLSWEQATTKVQSFNTIAQLTFHIGYYVSGVLQVLQGGTLDAKDKFSFDHPPIQSQDDWEKMLEKLWADAENFAAAIEQLPESKIWGDFIDNKYGNYYRNLQGIIEHAHYHLGQIVLIKKMLLQGGENQGV